MAAENIILIIYLIEKKKWKKMQWNLSLFKQMFLIEFDRVISMR